MNRLLGAALSALLFAAPLTFAQQQPAPAADPPFRLAGEAEMDAWRPLFDALPEQPLELAVEEPAVEAGLRWQEWRFRSTRGQTVPGTLALPAGEGPFPVVLVGHGGGGSRRDFRIAQQMLARKGYASFAIDAFLHGERKVEGYAPTPGDPYHLRDAVLQTVVDWRRALDALATRPELDGTRVAYLGASFGALIGSVFCGVEPRVRAAIFAVGGGNWRTILGHWWSAEALAAARTAGVREAENLADMQRGLPDGGPPMTPGAAARVMACVEPLNYLRRFDRPALFVCARRDMIIPPATQQALYDAAPGPKEQRWFDESHYLNPLRALAAASAFLERVLPAAPANADAPAHPADAPSAPSADGEEY